MPKTIDVRVPRLHPGQRRVVENAARFNVLMCGRRYGKTTLGVERALNAAVDKRQPVGWFAPNYSYLLEPMRDIRTRLGGLVSTFNKQEKQAVLITGVTVDFWTMDNPDAGRGRKYGRIILDEAGFQRGLQDVWDAAIRPTLSDYRGDAYIKGTPKGRGEFFRMFRKGQQGDKGWASFHAESVDNPYIDPAEIEAARRDMPKEVFDQEYRGIPAEDGGNPFGIQHIEACLGDMSDGEPVVYGIDLARKQDWTVLVGLDENGRVCRFSRFQLGWEETTRRIKDEVGWCECLVDATGVGDAVVAMLEREGVNVIPFVFTGRSKQNLMLGLATAIQQRNITYPEGDIADELRVFGYETRGVHTYYEAPAGMHDDCVMALGLAWKRFVERVPVEVKVWS